MREFELRPTLYDPDTNTSLNASCTQQAAPENSIVLEAVGGASVIRLRVYWPEWRAFVKMVEQQVKESEAHP